MVVLLMYPLRSASLYPNYPKLVDQITIWYKKSVVKLLLLIKVINLCTALLLTTNTTTATFRYIYIYQNCFFAHFSLSKDGDFSLFISF